MNQLTEHDLELPVGGALIRGTWFAPAASPAPVLIILHGIPRAKPAAGDSSYHDLGRDFARAGFLSLIFNFEGTGVSDGDIGMAAWVRDLEAVIEAAVSLPGADAKRLALLGFSAGGAVAIRVAAADPRVGAVVSGSSPAEFSFLDQTMGPARWIELFRNIGLIRTPGYPASVEQWQAEFEEVAPERWVDRIAPRPLLLIHGQDDEVIPVEHARRLYERAGEPRDLVVIPGGRHRLRVDPRALEEAMNWLVRWKDNGVPAPGGGR